MKVKFSNKGTTLIASIIGELDHHSADYVKQKIDNELIKSSTKNLIFDFSNLTFIDSSGIGVIMGRYKYITKLNGKALIVNICNQTSRMLEISGIFNIIPVYDNIETAINIM